MNDNLERPYLSIIVPIYNTEQYLEKCIESILDQTYTDYELILVDDGSTDNCLSICKHYAEQDSRIQVIHQKNRGVTSARKAGLNAACGEYISFIDSDDWMEPDFYSIFIDGCQRTQADIIIAAGCQKEEDWDGGINEKIHMNLRSGTYHQRKIKQILEKDRILPALWLKLFKRKLISKNIQLIDNRVFIGEDMLCSYACMLDADSIVVQNNYLYHYVRNGSSDKCRYREKNIKSMYYFAENLKHIKNMKKAYFLSVRWNQVILDKLWYIILCEFGEQKFLLNKRELKDLKRKFRGMELSRLLKISEYKMAVNHEKISKRLIFLLYSLKWYQLLNFYVKIYKAQDNRRKPK